VAAVGVGGGAVESLRVEANSEQRMPEDERSKPIA